MSVFASRELKIPTSLKEIERFVYRCNWWAEIRNRTIVR